MKTELKETAYGILIEEWKSRLKEQEEHLIEREQELAKHQTEQFQEEVVRMRVTVAEENAALYKGRMQAAEGYYKHMVEKMMLSIGMCPTCMGAVPQRKPCDCKVVDHV